MLATSCANCSEPGNGKGRGGEFHRWLQKWCQLTFSNVLFEDEINDTPQANPVLR